MTISHEAHELAERDLPCILRTDEHRFHGAETEHPRSCPAAHRPTVAATYQRFMDEIAVLHHGMNAAAHEVAAQALLLSDKEGEIAMLKEALADTDRLIDYMLPGDVELDGMDEEIDDLIDDILDKDMADEIDRIAEEARERHRDRAALAAKESV